jgi:hypothetical protein
MSYPKRLSVNQKIDIKNFHLNNPKMSQVQIVKLSITYPYLKRKLM